MEQTRLSQLPLFRALSPEARETLKTMVTRRQLRSGTMVLSEGEPSTELFILAYGTVEIFVDTGEVELSLGELTAPTFFGLMGILENAPRSSSIRAKTDVTVVVVPKGALQFVEEHHPVDLLHFFQRCFLAAAHRLRLTNDMVERHFREKLEEQKAALVQIEGLYEETLSVARARERILNHVSHELKTPIAIVSGSIHMLAKRLQGDEKAQQTMKRCQRNLQRLVDIQEHMLDIYQGKSTLTATIHKLERINVVEIVEAFSARALEKADNRQVELRVNTPPRLFAMAPRKPLVGAVVGLIRNAIEATPEKGLIVINVEHSSEDQVVITVRDHGVGIRRDNLKHIFEGFFHTQDTSRYSSKRPYDFDAGGKGLDLLRTKTYADRFGWRIEVDSEPCPGIPSDNDVCPGSVSACPSCQSPHDCHGRGQTEFRLILPFCHPPDYQLES